MLKSKFRSLALVIALAVLSSGTSSVAKGQALSASAGEKLETSRSKVDDMLDREAIRDLPIIYCHYVWEKNIDGIVDQFTADGELLLPANLGGRAKGTRSLREFYAKSIATTDPRPFIHNHLVTLLGKDRAKGYVYAEIRYGTQGFRTTTIGVYEDEYVKIDGAWKIKSRKFTSSSVTG